MQALVPLPKTSFAKYYRVFHLASTRTVPTVELAVPMVSSNCTVGGWEGGSGLSGNGEGLIVTGDAGGDVAGCCTHYERKSMLMTTSAKRITCWFFIGLPGLSEKYPKSIIQRLSAAGKNAKTIQVLRSPASLAYGQEKSPD
ncbi:MAG: hypothetical protein WCF90_04325 [Methanomicrobiales archaeon]